MRLNKTDHGLITIVDPGSDTPVLEVRMLSCRHCGGQFPAKPMKDVLARFYTAEEARQRQAKGKTLRGWCMSCQGPICGPGCAECVPLEQYLENMEQGRPDSFRPVVASVPREILLANGDADE